jgi:hypothetical protein
MVAVPVVTGPPPPFTSMGAVAATLRLDDGVAAMLSTFPPGVVKRILAPCVRVHHDGGPVDPEKFPKKL